MASSKEGMSSTSSKQVCKDLVDELYMQKFMQKLLHLLEQKEGTDVTLKTDDLEIPCHWVVLSAASEYFRGNHG